MVFITVFLKSMLEKLRASLLLLVFIPWFAWAGEIEVFSPEITQNDDGYVVSADFQFSLNPRLEEAVFKGLALYFVADFELTRARWYWFDEKLVKASQTFRLSYHALTRQYRLSTGSGLHQSFVTLNEAIAVLSRLRNWQVIDRSAVSSLPNEALQASLRIQLDITQLPRPFQITSLGNKDWSLASDWKTWLASFPQHSVAPK